MNESFTIQYRFVDISRAELSLYHLNNITLSLAHSSCRKCQIFELVKINHFAIRDLQLIYMKYIKEILSFSDGIVCIWLMEIVFDSKNYANFW